MTAEIVLSSGDVAFIDEGYLELVSTYKWSPRRCPCTTYAQANLPTVNGKRGKITMHRLVTNAQPGQTVDHDDWNGLNNQRYNLRVSNSRHGNNWNARLRADSTSGYKGVSYYRAGGNWQAYVNFRGQRQYLGYFATAEEAALAYDIMAKALFGSYASLNDIVAVNTVETRVREALTAKAGQLSEVVRDPRVARDLFGGIR